jgi:hypothetical protein
MENMDRLSFTQEQKQTLQSIEASKEEKALKIRAEQIKTLELNLRKSFYSGKATEKEITPALKKIADLRTEQTLGFAKMQNKLIEILSQDQYDELRRIMAESGIQ